MSEQDTEDLARVAYAAYAKAEGWSTAWPPPHQRTEQTIREMTMAVREAVLAQVVPEAKTEPACVHNWAAVDYWRDLGTLTLYCTHCAVVQRREVPKA